MKKISAALLVGLSTFSYAQNNNLVVYSQDGQKFTLILNGVRQNPEPETNVKVTGLNAPKYQAKIVFAGGMQDIDQNIYLMDAGNPAQNTEFSNAVVNKKGTWKLAFKSAAPIPAVPVPDPQQSTVVYLPADVVSGTTTTTQTVSTSSGRQNPENVSVSIGTPGGGISMNINDPGMATGTSVTTTSATVSTTSSSGTVQNSAVSGTSNPYVLSGYSGAYGCPLPMSEADFASAKQSILSKDFDESRLTVAKQIIGNNCLLCKQIKELMELMSFEGTKLDLAKFAWHHNLDKGNYYRLNDAFTFESSIDELSSYTQSH